MISKEVHEVLKRMAGEKYDNYGDSEPNIRCFLAGAIPAYELGYLFGMREGMRACEEYMENDLKLSKTDTQPITILIQATQSTLKERINAIGESK